jgi:hypothetical protein
MGTEPPTTLGHFAKNGQMFRRPFSMHEVNREPFILPIPLGWDENDAALFRQWVIEFDELKGTSFQLEDIPTVPDSGSAALVAGVSLLRDLAVQGWSICDTGSGKISITPAAAFNDVLAEKERVRAQEAIKRNEQMLKPSVRAFIKRMEAPREHNGKFVSIFSVMRDGEELARSLADQVKDSDDPKQLRNIVDPYVSIVNSVDKCPHTGLRLLEIWRYFRLTWSNQYQNTPGRTMQILIRDRAAPCHPIIGISSLGSPVIQIANRDTWIGWQAEQVVSDFKDYPTNEKISWIKNRLNDRQGEIYSIDLINDGLFSKKLWKEPKESTVAALEKESTWCKEAHYRLSTRSSFRTIDPQDLGAWEDRSQTSLFRSRRCGELAKLLRSKMELLPCFEPEASCEVLRELLEKPGPKRALGEVAKRAKADAVGTEIADLTVCGSVAPYNELIGGKLVAMLSVSPTVVRAYKERYRNHPGNIVSSVAGRPIYRRSNLVYIGTTSLYGSGSSQYNRLWLGEEVLGSSGNIKYQKLGYTRSFGTSHFSSKTMKALVTLVEQSDNGIRVNSIFGEGVNPTMRRIRQGLSILGWPAERLLQHGRQRILYGVSLVSNLSNYLLGMDVDPNYLFSVEQWDDTDRIASWWYDRWLFRRCQRPEVLKRLAESSLRLPVVHRARVTLPPSSLESGLQQLPFES